MGKIMRMFLAKEKGLAGLVFALLVLVLLLLSGEILVWLIVKPDTPLSKLGALVVGLIFSLVLGGIILVSLEIEVSRRDKMT